jgi:hypothetical protein
VTLRPNAGPLRNQRERRPARLSLTCVIISSEDRYPEHWQFQEDPRVQEESRWRCQHTIVFDDGIG